MKLDTLTSITVDFFLYQPEIQFDLSVHTVKEEESFVETARSKTVQNDNLICNHYSEGSVCGKKIL